MCACLCVCVCVYQKNVCVCCVFVELITSLMNFFLSVCVSSIHGDIYIYIENIFFEDKFLNAFESSRLLA